MTSTDSTGAPEATSHLAFRPPLVFECQEESSHDHTSEILPILSRLYIACEILQVKPETRFSVLIFLHRYTVSIGKRRSEYKSIQDWKWIAVACLFLGTKAEEESRRMRDVINLGEMLFSSNNNNKDKGNEVTISESPPDLNEAYWEAKTKLVETEQIVLRWLGFDLSVSHPHRAVVLLLESHPLREKLMPVAFRRLNDALFYGPALKHNVLTLACAAIDLAQEEINTHTDESLSKGWNEQYNLKEAELSRVKSILNNATDYLKEHTKNE